MPFVRIYVTDHFAHARAAIGDGVHRALVEAVAVPAGDRFQVITAHPDGEMIWDRNYLGVERSDRAVFVEITFRDGRDDAKKRALYAAIARNLEADAGVRPQDVLIALHENVASNWSFGNGLAHYALAP
ncbi:MAG: tautomerase family protein [Vulcanimicrobiaceae bacterium]